MSIMSEFLIFHILKLFMSNVRDIGWRLTQKARRTCKVRGSLEILFSSCACAYVQKHLYDNCRLKNGSIPMTFLSAMKSSTTQKCVAKMVTKNVTRIFPVLCRWIRTTILPFLKLRKESARKKVDWCHLTGLE